MGDYSLCKTHALVCNGQSQEIPNHLPGNMYLQFSINDILEIKTKVMNVQHIQMQMNLCNTNGVESYHRAMLSVNPKAITL